MSRLDTNLSAALQNMDAASSTANSLISLDRDQRAVVQLDPDHPGFRDLAYRKRRNQIAQIAIEYVPGTPVPDAPYVEEEHAVWREVWRNLMPAQDQCACQAYLDARGKLALPTDRLPQLRDVSERLQKLSDFRLEPAAGLVEPGIFLSALADGIFMSTQYIRHPSSPLYTPEPDVVHELVGHAVMLVDEEFAELNRMVGEAARRTKTPEQLERLGRIYWFTIEFGVLREGGELKAYGAGLLSSAGELQHLPETEVVPFDLDVIESTDFDVTIYQPLLFCADSQAQVIDSLRHRISHW